MRAIVIIVTIWLIASPASAQAAGSAADTAADWQALTTALRHVADDVQALMQENAALKAEVARLKAPEKTQGGP